MSITVAVHSERDKLSPGSIDDYIGTFPPDVQAILQQIRLTIRRAAPRAQEKISYKMPAIALDGDLIYFAAFKKHIGVFPPVRGDEKLAKELSRYRGDKGNPAVPSRRVHSVRLDQESREVQSQRTPGSNAIKAKEEIATGCGIDLSQSEAPNEPLLNCGVIPLHHPGGQHWPKVPWQRN